MGNLSKSIGATFHIINGIRIGCSGQDCEICKKGIEDKFKSWQNTVPFPFPPKGKKYKNNLKQKNRGKTITEICLTCKKTPCWICRRFDCSEWMKEPARKGQEAGCESYENGRCSSFVCERGLVNTHWRNYEQGKKSKRNKKYLE